MKRTAICFFLGLLLLGCQSKQDHYYWQKLKLASGIDKNVLNIRREKELSPMVIHWNISLHLSVSIT
ncbi:hypothetical protein BWI93_07635 [Siphonobacter sp. BAB-5385]|uniref:hypothetical protein n=1 Tax=Siphonobacter sp. BAB-5385 TaxID=1864822 RepID=UPI000B9E251C|nr:hypothetical protein [Siphonobacter sp. BAB-5385]OZI08716.1 hypothetical protein BWI93_07635 [Siphonobacter sp. BAB-5385]